MSKRRAKAESEQSDTIRQYLQSPAARELMVRISDGDAAARKRLAEVGIRWPERPDIEDYERLAMLCGESLDFVQRGNFTLAHLVDLAEARAASATWRARLAAAADAAAGGKTARPAKRRVKLSKDRLSVEIDGELVRLNSEADGEFVAMLWENRGKSVSGKSLELAAGPRPDRIYKRLPKVLRGCISPPGRGQTGYIWVC